MLGNYLIFVVIFVGLAASAIRSIKKKDVWATIGVLLMFPFLFSMLVHMISGGRAIHDAKNDYELYQAGHYYLQNGGDWLEVTYQRYRFVLVSEIIGLLSLQAAALTALIHRRKENDSPAIGETWKEKFSSTIMRL